MVLDGKLSSLLYCDIVIQQLKYESIEQIFTNVLQNLDTLVQAYIPPSFVEQMHIQLFVALLDCLE